MTLHQYHNIQIAQRVTCYYRLAKKLERTLLRGFEKRVLRILKTLRGESDRRVEKTEYEEVHKLYSLLNIFRIMKSRRMRLVRNGACMEDL
jgi:hypothetical protein